MKIELMRKKVEGLIERPVFTKVVVTLIVLNAIVLGLETYSGVMAAIGPQLLFLDQLLLSFFVVELAARLFAQGRKFFKDPWNLFDAVIIGVALLPASGALSVIRTLRILRVLRLVSLFPNLRRVIEGIVAALPGMGSIGALLLILYYVSAVVATKLFGVTHPQWFGSLDASLFSLFQVMTLEGWAEMARDLALTQPLAIPFLVTFILVATFTVLNLFIGVMLDAMQRLHLAEHKIAIPDDNQTDTVTLLISHIRELDSKVEAIAGALEIFKTNDKNKIRTDN